MNFKQILRSILSDRVNTLVIIISLAVGLVSINLVVLFIGRELGTDNFHKNSDRIYALKCDDPWLPGKQMYHCLY